jgi:hypothetical protein
MTRPDIDWTALQQQYRKAYPLIDEWHQLVKEQLTMHRKHVTVYIDDKTSLQFVLEMCRHSMEAVKQRVFDEDVITSNDMMHARQAYRLAKQLHDLCDAALKAGEDMALPRQEVDQNGKHF